MGRAIITSWGVIMPTSVKEDVKGTSTEFGPVQLKANAAVYREHASLINAASKYDSVEDAIAALKVSFEILEKQIVEGVGYTPPIELGFGSDSAAVIGESLVGRRNSIGQTRKMFKDLGK